MSETTAAADVTGWLERLAETHKAATPGPWRCEPRIAGAGVVHGSNGAPAASTYGSQKNAAAIVAAHNALPQFVQIARAADHLLTVWAMTPGDEKLAAIRAGMAALRAALGAEVAGR